MYEGTSSIPRHRLLNEIAGKSSSVSRIGYMLKLLN